MIDIFSLPLCATPENPLVLYFLKPGQNQRPFYPVVPVPEVLLLVELPGGQALDPEMLGQELGVAVEECLAVRLVLEPLVALALESLVVLVEVELAELLEVALPVEAVVEEELAG